MNGPAYINLSSQSAFAFLCERYSLDGELFYLLGLQIEEDSTNHAIYDCPRVISLPPFKPAGVFLAYKTSEHVANESNYYFLNGSEANVHYLSDDPLMTIDVSDGVGGVSYACIEQKWNYSVVSP